MDKKQILVTALTLTVGMGIGSFWMGSTSAPSTEAQAQEEQGHDDHDAHGNEGAAKESAEGEHAEGETEEGHLILSDEQISSAGIQLVEAKAQSISLSLPFPGEIRFDEDRTAHVVPRVPGVVESVHVNLGQPMKKRSAIGRDRQPTNF